LIELLNLLREQRDLDGAQAVRLDPARPVAAIGVTLPGRFSWPDVGPEDVEIVA
jgi:hypothetical protein